MVLGLVSAFFALGSSLTLPELEVRWEAPEGCSAAASIQTRMRAEIEPPTDAAAMVEGTVLPIGGGFRLSLVVDTGTTRVARTLEAATCEELEEAARLIVAVALEGGNSPEDEPPPPPPPPQATPPVAPPPQVAGDGGVPERAPAAVVTRKQSPRSRWGLAATTGVGFELVTPLTFGVGGEIQWIGGRWRLQAAGTQWFAGSVRVEDEGEIRTSLTHGTVRGCRADRIRRVEVPICVGVALGGLLTDPEPTTLDLSRTLHFWGGATLSMGANFVFKPSVAVFARTTLVVPFVRPELSVQDGSTSVLLYRTPGAGGMLELGVEFRVP